ncbi:hypothetical protein EOA53_31830, partial [Mesorhizobium sp. M1A.F.Ca.IN.020.03.1.1]
RSRWTETYDLNEFAAKHGLTTRQAEIVIQSNGPSKRKCDLAAEAFRAALRQCSHSREKGARRSEVLSSEARVIRSSSSC